ncbi:MAG: cyanophycinase [Planctomycetes bacterium]|nr:cyanophycinase [Planctomycetota bacterium]
MSLRRLVSLLALAFVVSACASTQRSALGPTGASGTLLIVGGGLDDDSRPIYERFVGLASARGPANIVVMTAATGPEEVEITDKTESLRIWAPDVPVRAVRRETSTQETVAAIDAATALLFTGGDQKRITARYRPNDTDTPEWLAMRRLLARGGVIAGCSAGDAMMGEVMLLGGSSAAALGVAPKDDDPKDPTPLGPRVAPGMRFLPWAVTDSHFFERDRVGRLVVALEASGKRLGLGVGEDGCVEVDLATGMVRGVGVSESLLVDVGRLARDGARRTQLLACVIRQGDELSLVDRLASPPQALPAGLAGAVRDVPVVEPGQNRQLASWRIFRTASRPGNGAERLALEGWDVLALPAGNGEVVFEVGPR